MEGYGIVNMAGCIFFVMFLNVYLNTVSLYLFEW